MKKEIIKNNDHAGDHATPHITESGVSLVGDDDP